jgi:uncharacterized lipoprotein YmbA
MRPTIVLLAALLAGCASPPPPTLFTLAPVLGAARPAKAGGIELRRVGLAGYLDRNDIVRSAAGYRLSVTADQRWAEPLGKMLDRVLSEDLAQRLPNSSVFTESGAIQGNAALILELNIQRLDADADGTVVLQAQVALHPDGSKTAPRTDTIRLTATPAGPGTADLVATMSSLLGQLTDRVATMVEPGRTKK